MNAKLDRAFCERRYLAVLVCLPPSDGSHARDGHYFFETGWPR
jgi:hypothetical protein